jgi:hypothetical protein
MFCNDPAGRALYRTVVLVEYGFGGRVYEILDRFHGGNPDLSPESDRPYINHAVKARDLLLRWSCEGRWHPICTVATFPDGPAQVAELLHDHTKNHPDGPTPVAVWRNPRGHDSPFCILHELTQFALYWCHGMAPEQTLECTPEEARAELESLDAELRLPNQTHSWQGKLCRRLALPDVSSRCPH